MARITSKAETVAIGSIVIIAIIIAAIVFIVQTIVNFVILYWIYILIVAIPMIGLIIFAEFKKFKKLSIEIYKLNLEAESIKQNIIKDYQLLACNSELFGMFDNAVKQFPRNTFLNFATTSRIEDSILSSNQKMRINRNKLLELKMSRFYCNNILFKPFILPEINCNVIPENLFSYITKKVSDRNLYSNPFPQDYEMFTNIVSQKFPFSSRASQNICIWKFLLNRAEQYYFNYWDSNYRHYFEEASSAGLPDLVKCYCDISYIDHLDMYNIAMFSYYLSHINNNPDIYSFYSNLRQLIKSELEQRKLKSFEKRLLESSEHAGGQKQRYSINDTDLMNGSQFENFIALLFKHMGYNTTVTPASGDQGIDIIAENGSEKIGIQAKRYSNVVPNSAIQEVVAGIAYHNCNKGMVVTNNAFTKSAVTLAKSNDIILWDRQKLENIINEVL